MHESSRGEAVPAFPHHVTERGNRRAEVFETAGDYEAYLRFVKQYADKRALSVWAYCLVRNHVHLVVVPRREDSLGLALCDANRASLWLTHIPRPTRSTSQPHRPPQKNAAHSQNKSQKAVRRNEFRSLSLKLPETP